MTFKRHYSFIMTSKMDNIVYNGICESTDLDLIKNETIAMNDFLLLLQDKFKKISEDLKCIKIDIKKLKSYMSIN
jgi:hypothetical protein